MKPKQAKEFIADITKRGWVKVGDKYLPPSQAKGIVAAKPKKPKTKVTGWIDDDRNIQNKKDNREPFIRLVEQELDVEVWPEFFFSTKRKYRLDFAIPVRKDGSELKIAIEVQGGIWMRGNSGHSSGTGIKRDMDKSNLAQSLGWFLIKVTPEELLSFRTLDLIRSRI